MGPSLLNHDGLRGADTVACLAFRAVILIDEKLVAEFDHSIKGTCLLTETAEDAVFWPNAERTKALTAFGPAELIIDMLLIFLTEIPNR